MAVRTTSNARLRRVMAVAAGLLLIGCSAQQTPTASERAAGTSAGPPSGGPTGVLTIAENEPPQTFDPQQSVNSTVNQLMLVIYDTLVQLAPGETEVHPELATEWEVSPDGTVYTFTLRDGVTFHDGAAFTAADVKYTLDRIKTVNTGVASEIYVYDSSEVIDDSTIAVTLSAPYSPFIAALTRVYILNSELVQPNEGDDMAQGWLATNDAGSGRYLLEEYQPNQQAAFTAYLDYWKGWDEPHVEQVVFRYIPDSGTQRVLIDSGEIDIAMDIAKDDLAAFADRDGFRVDVADTLVQLYFWFNMATVDGPTADPRVREAISMAYDYDTHVESILLGYGAKAEGPLPKPMPCHLAGVTQPTFDLDAAAALLQDAGYGDGLEISISYLSALDEMRLAFELLQSNLTQIGVTVTPLPVTAPEYIEMVQSAETLPDLGMLYAFPTAPDPNAVMYINFFSGQAGAGYNWSHYNNPDVDELVTAAQQTSDQAERCPLYEEAQDIIANDYVTINASIPQYTTVLRSAVQGYQYNLAHHQTVNVTDIWIEE